MFIIGSVQKLGEHGQYAYGSEMKDYIGSSKAFHVGDQHKWFCINVGLKAVVPNDHGVFMWPASCRGFGIPQCNNICTYMEEIELECTARPCVTELGMETELGDHSLTAGVGGW